MYKKLISILLFISLVLTAPVKPTAPSEDEFYSPPSGFEDAELGSILKMRTTPFQITSVYFPVNIANSWQVLVRSEDSLGNATAVVATIFEPYEANSSRLLSYQIAEDASNIDCAMSYSFMGGGGLDTIEAKVEMFFIQAALDQGYYVVSSDYEGPIAAFTAGKLAAYSTLNSIRAALSSSNTTGIDPDADVVMWGYSGGTIPSGWAAALAPTYAEDLTSNLKGVALGGWVTNITATVEVIEGTVFAGLTANGVIGLSHQYPEMIPIIKKAMSKDDYERYEDAGQQCLVSSIFDYAFTKFFSGPNRHVDDGWDILSTDVINKVIKENTLGVEETEDLKPEIPVFVYHGVLDEVVPFKDAQRVYDIWCDDGMDSFEFAVSNSTGHILEFLEGCGAALRWIDDMFNGVEPVKGCKRTVRSTNLLYPKALSGYYDIAAALGNNILGTKIGPIDLETMLNSLKSKNVDPEKLKKRNTNEVF